jgi:hypothetical protein
MNTRPPNVPGLWRRPTAADLDLLSRAAHERAEPPATVTASKLLQRDLHLGDPAAAPPPRRTFWEIWSDLGERGGFYIRKPYWSPTNRFCVAAVVDHNDRSGRKVVLGRYCEPGASRAARLTQDLDLRTWLFDGLTLSRQRGADGEDVA